MEIAAPRSCLHPLHDNSLCVGQVYIALGISDRTNSTKAIDNCFKERPALKPFEHFLAIRSCRDDMKSCLGMLVQNVEFSHGVLMTQPSIFPSVFAVTRFS